MTKAERIAVVYGLSVLGAAGVSYLRGKRGLADLGMDAALPGALAGTGINVVLWMSDSTQTRNLLTSAKANAGQKDCACTGKVSKEGVGLLSMVNPENLYRAAKMVGVHIGPAPENPYNVALPPE